MYEYLKQFVNVKYDQFQPNNVFDWVNDIEIKKAEKELGITFPSELRQFYKEIGSGCLTHPIKFDKDYIFYSVNRINPPSMIVDMVKNGHGSGLISEDTYEMLQPGDLPVFEIGDSSSFMIMKPKSDNPNAVWLDDSIVKIEDSFERFIWRLYHEDPGYYGDIIAKYQTQET